MTTTKSKYSRLIFNLFILLFLLNPAYTSAAGVHGKHKDYAGKTIRFFRYADPVTLENEEIFTLVFDSQGNFKSDIQITSPTYVFGDFGIYRGMLFLEPGNNPELLFPPLREKTFADEKNPFFEPIEFWFATGDKSLNNQIAAFEQKLNELTARFFNRLYFRQSKEVFDSLVHLINAEFPDNTSSTFTWHKRLRLKSIETEAFRLKPAQVAGTFSTAPSEVWAHEAYAELLDKVFANKLGFEVKSTGGEKLHKAMNAGNIDFLVDFIHKTYMIKGDAASLVAVKLLHDGFYSGEFPQQAILSMLGSNYLKNHPDAQIRQIAKNTTAKLKFLLPGTKAPVICLENINGKEVCTNEMQDKFRYLLFADTEMVVCQEQLKYLTEIEKKFGEHLQIIIVLKKTDLIEMKMFLEKNNIPGVKLIDENGVFIDKYNVRSFPDVILLNENHEVVFQHTKAPLDGFEQQFAPYLQKKIFERQRNQAR